MASSATVGVLSVNKFTEGQMRIFEGWLKGGEGYYLQHKITFGALHNVLQCYCTRKHLVVLVKFGKVTKLFKETLKDSLFFRSLFLHSLFLRSNPLNK
jgi:hypothetical protein